MIRLRYVVIGIPVYLALCWGAFNVGSMAVGSVFDPNNVAGAAYPGETITVPYKVWTVSKSSNGGLVSIQTSGNNSSWNIWNRNLTLEVSKRTEEAVEEGDDVVVTVQFLPKKAK